MTRCRFLLPVLLLAPGCFDLSRPEPASDGPTDVARARDSRPNLPPADAPQLDDGQQLLPPNKTCAEITQCASVCGTHLACITGCENQGSAHDKAAHQALVTCTSAARAGGCQNKCGDPASELCKGCAEEICHARVNGCLGAGTIIGEFGKACHLAFPQCLGGQQCVSIAGGGVNKGFCTRTCPVRNAKCDGTPTGTKAACVYGAHAPSIHCAFICELAGLTWNCPNTLVCGPEQPAGSGQRLCVPDGL